MKYAVIFEQTGTGWGASAPDLPGCIATGQTLEETRARMSEAMHFHITAMLEDGDPIPEPSTVVGTVEVD